MLDHRCPFPVTEVGLGQVGVMRTGRHELYVYGKLLQQAARLFRGKLEPRTLQPAKRRRRQPSPGPLSLAAPDDKLKP